MLTALVLASLLQVSVEVPSLEPGHPLTLELDETHAAVESGALVGQGARGTALSLRVEASGTYTIQLRAARFDAYLQLTDTAGTAIAEDDDGWTGTQARLVVELEAGRDYLVKACALRAGVGGFEITLGEGPPLAAAQDRQAVELADFHWCLAQLEREVDDPELLSGELQALGGAWFNRGYVTQGLEVLQRRVTLATETWGPESTNATFAHYDHSFHLFQAGRPDEAEPEMRAAVASLEQLLGPHHPTTLSTYAGLAHLEQARGRVLEARVWFERSAAGYVERGEAGTRNAIMTDVGLGGTLVSLGEDQAARDLLTDAIARAEALGPPGEDLVAYASGALSELVIRAGDYEAGYELKQRAREVLAKQWPPTHPNMLNGDINLLALLRAMGRMEEHRVLGEDLLTRLEASSRIGTRQHAWLLLELAMSAQKATDHDMALERARDAALLAAEIGDRELLASSLGQVASTLLSLGHVSEAREPLESSIELLRGNEGESRSWALQMHRLGSLLYELGDHEAAADAFRRVAAWYEPRGYAGSQAAALGGLGVALIRLGREEEALATLNQAYALSKQSGLPLRNLASDLSNLGLIHERRGELEQARQLFQRALDGLAASDRPDPLMQATFLGNLAIVQRRLGDPRDARESAEQVLEFAPGFETTTRLIALDNLALTWLDLGDSEQAWITLQRDAPRLRAETDALLAASSEPERYQLLDFRLAHLDHVLAVAEQHGTPAVETGAYEELLHWKGLVGRQLLATRERLAQDLSPELRGVAEELRVRRAELAQHALSDDPSQVEALRADVARLERELQGMVDLHGSGSGVSFAQLRDALPDDAVVVDFAVHQGYGRATDDAPITTSGRVVTAFVTRAGATAPERIGLGPVGELEAAVAAHLEGIGVGSPPDDQLAARGRTLGRPTSPDANTDRLRELLWEPLAPLVAGATTLIVAPEGALATLPFETLRVGEGRFLIEDFGVVTLSDVGLIARAEGPSGVRLDSLLVIGDVDYGARAALDEASEPSLLHAGVNASWTPLPGTGVEAAGVLETHADAFGADARRLELRGADATEERLLDELGRFDTVHLATHGYFRPTELASAWDAARSGAPVIGDHLAGRRPGLLSGLVCAGANTPTLGRADGYLTAEELGSADLTDLQLVVLSACETGLGRPQAGEGLLGVRRAFLTAGANTVVSSLWSVPDESTARLMQAFYDNLWERGLGRGAALRQAQLQLLEHNRRELGHPAVQSWGAFVLDGEWR
jgi:CHAT domain-containing protein/tetratricopeptide (TPR) repeat protein